MAVNSQISAHLYYSAGFQGGSVVKNPLASAGDTGSIPGLGGSPGEGNGNTLQYSCLGNPMDRGAWQAIVHAVSKSGAQLSNYTTAAKYYGIVFRKFSFIIGIFAYRYKIHLKFRNEAGLWLKIKKKWLLMLSLYLASFVYNTWHSSLWNSFTFVFFLKISPLLSLWKRQLLFFSLW